MKTNRWVQVTIVVVVVALLAAGSVSHASLPVSGQNIKFASSSSEGAAAETGQPEAHPGNVPEGLTAGDWATMQDLMREAQYQFTWQVSDGAWAYHAPNRAHDLSLSLASDGLHAAHYSADGEVLWDLRLSLAAYGEQTFPAAAQTIFDDGKECMAGDKLLLVPFEIARTYSAQCKQIKVDEYGETYLVRAERVASLNSAEARLIARIAFYGRPAMSVRACAILKGKGRAARDFWNRLKGDGICR